MFFTRLTSSWENSRWPDGVRWATSNPSDSYFRTAETDRPTFWARMPIDITGSSIWFCSCCSAIHCCAVGTYRQTSHSLARKLASAGAGKLHFSVKISLADDPRLFSNVRSCFRFRVRGLGAASGLGLGWFMTVDSDALACGYCLGGWSGSARSMSRIEHLIVIE